MISNNIKDNPLVPPSVYLEPLNIRISFIEKNK